MDLSLRQPRRSFQDRLKHAIHWRPDKALALRIVTLFLLGIWYWNAVGGAIVDFDKEGRRYDLAATSQTLEDPDGQLSINDLLQDQAALRFSKGRGNFRNYGVTASTVWAKLDVRNITARSDTRPDPTLWYLEFARAYVDVAELYVVERDASGQAHVKQVMDAGIHVPLHQRTVRNVNPVFPITIDPSAPPELYLRAANSTSLNGSLSLWDPHWYARKVTTEGTLYGVFLGGILALIFYNVCMYFSMRDRAHLYYLGYIIPASLSYLINDGNVTLLVDDFDAGAVKALIPAIIWLTWIFVFLFTSEFLELRSRHPVMHRIIQAALSFSIFSFCMMPFIDLRAADVVTVLASAMLMPILLSISGYLMWRGDRDAMFFTIAWICNLAGAMVQAGIVLGAVEPTALAMATYPTGMLFEALLLSFSLADKIKNAQKAAEQANQRALELTRSYGRKLEDKVAERTAHLKATQQALVSKQKGASLGVLTAGIAHELADPTTLIRAGIHNVEDWADQFRHLIDGMIDEDTEEEVRRLFAARFERLFEQIDVVTTGANRLHTIVSGLRTLTRLDQSERRTFNAGDSLERVVNAIKNGMGADIEFHLQLAIHPSVQGWPHDLEVAFTAILSNAVYAIREREAGTSMRFRGVVHITTSAMMNGQYGWWQINISDNGVGMSPDVMERAFDPFYTTRQVGSGAGLGLAVTRETIEKHGGVVTLDSKPMDGTRVFLMLPVGER